MQQTRRSHAGIWPLALAATALWILPDLHPFVTMCCISLSLFALIKLHTLVSFLATSTRPDPASILWWFVAWPGLDARGFFSQSEGESSPTNRPGETLFAISKMLFGFTLLGLIAPRLLAHNKIVAGWTALIGTVFVLHFGGFHLLAIFWRARGRAVTPIMNAPVLATSVSDFWSKRWNLAFRDYAYPNLFKPLARRWSPALAVGGGYAFSGIVHELAISLPAGAGYGLPTLYFTLQGIAILVERRLAKTGIRIRGGWRGWSWTALVTAPAALILFHPPFIRSVVVPLVEFIRAGRT